MIAIDRARVDVRQRRILRQRRERPPLACAPAEHAPVAHNVYDAVVRRDERRLDEAVPQDGLRVHRRHDPLDPRGLGTSSRGPGVDAVEPRRAMEGPDRPLLVFVEPDPGDGGTPLIARDEVRHGARRPQPRSKEPVEHPERALVGRAAASGAFAGPHDSADAGADTRRIHGQGQRQDGIPEGVLDDGTRIRRDDPQCGLRRRQERVVPYEERGHEFARERLDGPHHARGVDAPHALLPRRRPESPVVGHRKVAHGRRGERVRAGDGAEPAAVEVGQPRPRADPQAPVRALVDHVDPLVREAVLAPEVPHAHVVRYPRRGPVPARLLRHARRCQHGLEERAHEERAQQPPDMSSVHDRLSVTAPRLPASAPRRRGGLAVGAHTPATPNTI